MLTPEEIMIIASVLRSFRNKSHTHSLREIAEIDLEDVENVLRSLEALGYAVIPRGVLVALKKSIESLKD